MAQNLQALNTTLKRKSPRLKQIRKLSGRTPSKFDAIYGLPGKLKNAPTPAPVRLPGAYAGVDPGAPKPAPAPGAEKFIGGLRKSRGQTLPQARQRRRDLSQRLIKQAGGKKQAFGADYNPAELQNVLSKLRASGSAPQIPGSPVVQTPGFQRLKARRSELLTDRRKALKKIYLRGNRQSPGGPKSGRPTY